MSLVDELGAGPAVEAVYRTWAIPDISASPEHLPHVRHLFRRNEEHEIDKRSKTEVAVDSLQDRDPFGDQSGDRSLMECLQQPPVLLRVETVLVRRPVVELKKTRAGGIGDLLTRDPCEVVVEEGSDAV
jgi:hypothetical protein